MSLETKETCPPDIFTSLVAAATISTPPSDAFITIASSTISLELIFTEDPVAVILISSPELAPVAVISTPPADAVNTTAPAPVLEDAIFTIPVVSISIPPVPASISIFVEVICKVVSASISSCPSTLEWIASPESLNSNLAVSFITKLPPLPSKRIISVSAPPSFTLKIMSLS